MNRINHRIYGRDAMRHGAILTGALMLLVLFGAAQAQEQIKPFDFGSVKQPAPGVVSAPEVEAPVSETATSDPINLQPNVSPDPAPEITPSAGVEEMEAGTEPVAPPQTQVPPMNMMPPAEPQVVESSEEKPEEAVQENPAQQPQVQPQQAQPEEQSEPQREVKMAHCDFDHLVGQPIDDIEMDDDERTMRILNPDSMVTMEYMYGRVNLIVEDDVVIDVTCG